MDQTKGSRAEKKGSKEKVPAVKGNAGDKPSATGTGKKAKKNNPNKPKLGQEQLKKTEADKNKNKEGPSKAELQQSPETVQKESGQGESQAKCAQNQQAEPGAALQLSEKEKRRLEWEKKLAEQKKVGPAQASNGSPSKAELKAQRRAQQEAQRQAKIADGAAKPAPVQQTNGTTEVVAEKSLKTVKSAVAVAAGPVTKKVQKTVGKPLEVPAPICNYRNVHPVFVQLGVRYATKQLIGSNARCIGLLHAMACLIQDIQVPPGQDFLRYLEQTLHSCVSYLESNGRRPLAMSMTSALRHFASKSLEAEELPTEKEKRSALVQSLLDLKLNAIDKSTTLIANKMHKAHVEGLQFATYGCSSMIGNVLIDLHKRQRHFHVYVFETPVLREGHELMRRLSLEGVPCSYASLSAARNVLLRTSKLLMGMHTIYNNYSVQMRAGAMLLTEVAQQTGTQVVVCHERYKLRDKDDVDTIKAVDVIKETVIETLPVRKRTVRPLKKKSKFRMVPMKYYHTTFDMVPVQAISSTLVEVSKIEETKNKRPFFAELFSQP